MAASDSTSCFAIVGAGCAGLSLARALVRRIPECRVVLFDARQEFRRDRTWCGWSFPDSTDELAVSHRWTRWQVRGRRGRVRRDLAAHPYRHIPADRYYETALAELRACDRVTLMLGAAVEAIEAGGDGVRVETARGRWVFDRVFDSRPVPADVRGDARIDAPARPELLQHFVGVEVETEEPCFPPDEITLMDFDVPQEDGLHFFYVLPFSATRALVEATFMTPPPTRVPDYQDRIAEYLRRRFGVTRWRVTFEERGGIPMRTARVDAAPHPRIWRIGVAAGIVKASSGYAFDAIQRDSVRVADAVLRDRPRPGPPRSRFAAALDRIFVSYLARNPAVGDALFTGLFERAAPSRLVRFLSDRARPLDYLAVMWAMPKLGVATHAVRSVREWW